MTRLGERFFEGCAALRSIDIPESISIVTLGRRCFEGCASLSSITIPSSVTEFGAGCFHGCTALTSVTLPTEVIYLESDCFNNCFALSSIVIPSSVTSVGETCFSNCLALTSVSIPASVTFLGNDCFMNCPSLTKVICEIPTPINKSSLFRATPIEEATLYVPEASLASYKTTSPWSDFGAILPISGAGIESITVGEPTIEAIYNLEGKRMNNMSRGLNILRMSDGTTKKVLNHREK